MSTDAREWPACKKCQQGLLIPLSDYGRDGAPITYKAWVCSNPECGFNIRIDNGEISFGRAIGQSFKYALDAVRAPAVSGRFYPGPTGELECTVRELLDAVGE